MATALSAFGQILYILPVCPVYEDFYLANDYSFIVDLGFFPVSAG